MIETGVTKVINVSTLARDAVNYEALVAENSDTIMSGAK